MKTHIFPAVFPALLAALALSGCGGQSSDSTSTNVSSNSSAGTKSTNANADAGGSGSSGGSGEKKTFLIGMSQANKGEPWRQAMNDQIAAAAAKHPELEVKFADAAQDNVKQVNDVENFLQQGIDLLIISPNEAAPLTDVVAKAFDKGIPVILLDRKVNGSKFTMHIGADNVDIGRRAGRFAVKWCLQNKRAGQVLEIRGLEGTSGTKERGQGFREGIAGSPLKIVAQQNADWLREKAIPISQAMLQANPSADVIYGHNEPMAEAAVISAGQASVDKAHKVLFVGVDGLPTPDGGLKSVLAGRLGVTYVYPTGGAQAVEYAVKILEQGAKPPREVVLPTEEVTKANAAQLLQKYGGK